ncbi:ankyrin repeat-containing domain protein [Leucosporidium creatinivorum]|uniref:Ankyrin repeat-containing domain protein n=1 Tax=Leucosporidium creatinivorum TaxID=106004 RepID=A0A1Y2EC44_9BASI|nr:ankyrin repeat-containing domain protein [Leucosporidium creatinivorum]
MSSQPATAAAPQTSFPTTLPPEAAAFARQFFDAARRGDVDAFRAPLEAGLPPNLTNDKGDTLVMLASYYGHAELVSLLIQHGADPNRINDRGQSPLAGAVFKNELAVIQALLDGGADPLAGTPSGYDTAKMFGKLELWGEKFDKAKGKGSASSE